jgi:hypothetical protein
MKYCMEFHLNKVIQRNKRILKKAFLLKIVFPSEEFFTNSIANVNIKLFINNFN